MKKVFTKLTFVASLALVTAIASAETYALCVGINDYPGEKNDLKGCVNDAKAYRDVFSAKYGVKPANIKLLLDKDVTLEKLLAEMKWLVGSAKPGDQIVFTYSGHGGQVADKSEADGFEEVISLADENMIPGDLFGELAGLLDKAGINSTFIFDSCFSGGVSRDVSGRFTRIDRSLGVVTPKNAKALLDSGMKMKTIKPRQMQAPQAGSHAFLFASQENKPSKDVSGLEGVPAHGLFTLLMVGAMNEAPSASIKDLYGIVNDILTDVNKKFKEQGSDFQFDQGPNFETTPDRANLPVILKA